MTRQRAILFLALIFSAAKALAVEPAHKVAPGAKVFIEGMSPEMQGYVAGEITKRKVPISLTMNKDSAEYILTGQTEMQERTWKRALFGGKADSGSAILYHKESGDFVWSGNAGGRSVWLGDNKSERRVAGRLAKQMKKDLFGK